MNTLAALTRNSHAKHLGDQDLSRTALGSTNSKAESTQEAWDSIAKYLGFDGHQQFFDRCHHFGIDTQLQQAAPKISYLTAMLKHTQKTQAEVNKAIVNIKAINVSELNLKALPWSRICKVLAVRMQILKELVRKSGDDSILKNSEILPRLVVERIQQTPEVLLGLKVLDQDFNIKIIAEKLRISSQVVAELAGSKTYSLIPIRLRTIELALANLNKRQVKTNAVIQETQAEPETVMTEKSACVIAATNHNTENLQINVPPRNTTAKNIFKDLPSADTSEAWAKILGMPANLLTTTLEAKQTFEASDHYNLNTIVRALGLAVFNTMVAAKGYEQASFSMQDRKLVFIPKHLASKKRLATPEDATIDDWKIIASLSSEEVAKYCNATGRSIDPILLIPRNNITDIISREEFNVRIAINGFKSIGGYPAASLDSQQRDKHQDLGLESLPNKSSVGWRMKSVLEKAEEDYECASLSTSLNDPEYQPTDAQVGSDAKIQVLRERLEKGFQLWHPADSSTYKARPSDD